MNDFKPRCPTVIPSGKFQGAPIGVLCTDDLQAAQREFFRARPAVQAAIMAELHRRLAMRRAHRGCQQQRGTGRVSGTPRVLPQ